MIRPTTPSVRGLLLGLALAVTAGAALAGAAQDCRSAALADEERESACKTAVGEAGSYADLAFTHLGAGHPEDALAAARRAVEIADTLTSESADQGLAPPRPPEELGPWQERAHGFLLQAMAQTGAADEAIAAYQDAQAAGIEDTEGHRVNGLAWGLFRAGEPEKALPVIEDWLTAHPDPTNIPDYHFILDTAAHVMAAAGEADKAVETFLRAAEVGGMGQRILYKSQLTSLGFAPEPDDEEGFEAALRACVATGDACKLS